MKNLFLEKSEDFFLPLYFRIIEILDQNINSSKNPNFAMNFKLTFLFEKCFQISNFCFLFLIRKFCKFLNLFAVMQLRQRSILLIKLILAASRIYVGLPMPAIIFQKFSGTYQFCYFWLLFWYVRFL